MIKRQMTKFCLLLLSTCLLSSLLSSISAAKLSPPILTPEGVRLQQVSEDTSKIHWIFVPGGPGMGSEYFLPLISQLDIEANIWLLDLPGNGSNPVMKEAYDFSQWADDLVKAIEPFESVVLVTHSFSSTLALSNKQLQEATDGLIIISSAPSADVFMSAQKRAITEEESKAIEQTLNTYLATPSDETAKDFFMANAVYFFNEADVEYGRELIRQIPVNFQPHWWANEHYFATYQATAIPTDIPVLIIGSHTDQISPISGFLNDERFKDESIQIEIIPNASHFPWVDNPDAVKEHLEAYSTRLKHL